MRRRRLIDTALALSLFLPPAVHAQVMQGGMMGGGRHGMINLVSPADSPTQIQYGVIMIGSYALGMMGPGSTGPATPGTGNAAPGIRLVLRLYGVSDSNGLVTNTNNHLIFDGELTAPTANREPIHFDQPFALNAGSGSAQAFIALPSITGPATITIDRIAVEDNSANVFAMPGVAFAQPTPRITPRPIPGTGCTNNSDCDDGNPNTRDLCMPIGCVHIPVSMGPDSGPMM
jgi:hypothetical protein